MTFLGHSTVLLDLDRRACAHGFLAENQPDKGAPAIYHQLVAWRALPGTEKGG